MSRPFGGLRGIELVLRAVVAPATIVGASGHRPGSHSSSRRSAQCTR